jgi:hypothetical protein
VKLSRRLVVAFGVEALLLVAIVTVAADLYAHKRTDMLAGRNIWGYRGSVAHQKEPNEIRFIVVGGTRAFALGMPATWTTATVVQQEVMLAIDRPGRPIRHFIGVDLAQPSALPGSYSQTIEHFAYLKPDVVCLYDDLGVGGGPLLDESSGMYARTGYLPALPLVLTEKRNRLLHTAGLALMRLDRSFARTPRERETDTRGYVAAMLRAIDVASLNSRSVVIALSPVESDLQSRNYAALIPELQKKIAENRRVRLVDLNGIAALTEPQFRLDGGWSYGGDATAAASKAIAPAVLQLIEPSL